MTPVTTETPDESSMIKETKSHFIILDGLRGIAALAVVIFHFMEWVYTDPGQNFIGHGFLAVDFFFCLSGFVLGYAYDGRIEKIGVISFFKSRLIRLHPLVLLGSVLGILALLADPFIKFTSLYSTGKLILIFTCSILLIPFPMMKERSFNLFGLNAPSWSLFWEYIANLVYALVLYRLNRFFLMVLTVLAGIGIFWVSHKAGNLLGGWGKDNFWDGGARVLYSFCAGLLVYRSNWIIKNRIGFVSLAILLSFAFVMPQLSWNWLAEPLIVLFYFPLLIALGAGSDLSLRMTRIAEFSGKLSYPLYMTHYWAIWLFAGYYTNNKPTTSDLFLIIPVGTVLLIGLGYVAMVVYDFPLRLYLNRRLKERF